MIKVDNILGELREDDSTDRLQLVGQRCGMNGQESAVGATNWRLNNYSVHYIPTGATAIQLIYSGFYLQSAIPGEKPISPNIFAAKRVSFSGGSGYAVGEILTFGLSEATGLEAVKVRVDAVDGSGVPTICNISKRGLYNSPLIGAVSQSSSTGSGSGAYFTFDWEAFAVGGHIGITPDANYPNVFTGKNAVKVVRNGFNPDGTINWSALIPLGGIYKSDIMPCDIPIGGKIGIRAVWGANNFPLGRVPNNINYGATANNEECYKGANWFDESNSGTIWLGDAASCIFEPVAIMGIPKKKLPAIIAIGDSRTIGSGSGLETIEPHDKVDADGNIGPFEKSLSRTRNKCFYPWSNFSGGGIALDHYFGTNPANLSGHQHLLDLVSLIKPDAIYFHLNTNDIFTGQPEATILSREQQFVKELKGLGVKKIIGATTDPETSSTDNYATVANQTVKSQEAVRVNRNNKLMNGTWDVEYDEIVDYRGISESSLNSGKWVANGTAKYATGDGTHTSGIITELEADALADVIKSTVVI